MESDFTTQSDGTPQNPAPTNARSYADAITAHKEEQRRQKLEEEEWQRRSEIDSAIDAKMNEKRPIQPQSGLSLDVRGVPLYTRGEDPDVISKNSAAPFNAGELKTLLSEADTSAQENPHGESPVVSIRYAKTFYGP